MAGSEGVGGEDILFKDKDHILGNGGGNGDVIGANETIDATVKGMAKLKR